MNRIVTMVLKNLPYLPGAMLRLWRYARHPERYPEEEMYRHIQSILEKAIRGGNVTLTVTGLENIPSEGGFMFYSNHQGLFDALAVLATCPRPIGAVLKKELYGIPGVHQAALCTQSYPMDREDVRQSLTVIQQVTEQVKSGRPYLLFPEGTRSRLGNEMLPFHRGSFRCATKSRCPIVPVALVDCYKVLDQKGSAPVAAQIHYLPPISYEQYKDLNTTDLAALVKDRIAEKIAAQTKAL